MTIIDLTGRRYGRLSVISRVLDQGRRHKRTAWNCRCDCGNNTIALGKQLVNGQRVSCGCSKIQHGHTMEATQSRSYKTWAAMRQRCLNPKSPNFKYYGGRGIAVCQLWADSFLVFLRDMGERPENRSIDRINPDGDYEPGNCRWATRSEQQMNRRDRGVNRHADCL
jgi:hypothetical protein